MKSNLRKEFEEKTKASESIDSRYVVWLENQIENLRATLREINQNKVLSPVNPFLPSSNNEDDLVPYFTICPCNPANGGNGICGCVMGNKLVKRNTIKSSNITFNQDTLTNKYTQK